MAEWRGPFGKLSYSQNKVTLIVYDSNLVGFFIAYRVFVGIILEKVTSGIREVTFRLVAHNKLKHLFTA